MKTESAKHILATLLLAMVLLAGCSTKGSTQIEREKRKINSPQYKDGKCNNPIKTPLMVKGGTWKYIKRRLFGSRIDPKPTNELPLKHIRQNDWTDMDQDRLVFAWLGHSSILIALDGKTVLVDPVFEKRASPFSWFGPQRFHPAPVTVAALPPIDVVLITHDHYDHLEEPTIRHLGRQGSLFLVPLGIGELLQKWEIASEKIVELDWWEQRKVGSLSFFATPAIHYARRGLFDGNERLWCSWAIHSQSRRLFISGDSGYFNGFKKVGYELGPFDLTFLKIGAYDETWKQIHMTPEEAVQQHVDLGGTHLVPLHWATFDLALHPWYEPIERMLTASQEKGVRFIAPIIGEQIDITNLPQENLWWRKIDIPKE